MFEVYCHTSPSGKRYVGWTSKGWRERWQRHRHLAGHGSMLPFHCAIRKYGADSFKHELLAVTDTEAGAHASEQCWIAARKTIAPGGYNATAGGEGVACPAPEVVAKMRAANIGKKASPETRAKMVAARTGRRRTPEFCERMRLLNTGRRHTEESKAKISAAKVGGKHTAEHCAKISASTRGIKRKPRTAEHTANQRATTLGRKLPPRTSEHSAAIRVGHARRKFKLAAKAAWLAAERAF